MSQITNYPFILGLLVGFILGMILTVVIVRPRVGQAIARIIAVILLGAGVGMLVWGIYAISTNQEISPIQFGFILVEKAYEIMAYGAGAFFAGVVALVLSFVRLGSRN